MLKMNLILQNQTKEILKMPYKNTNYNINTSNEDSNNAIKEHIDYTNCEITRVEIKHGQGIGTSCIDPKTNASKIILYIDIPDPEDPTKIYKATDIIYDTGTYNKKIKKIYRSMGIVPDLEENPDYLTRGQVKRDFKDGFKVWIGKPFKLNFRTRYCKSGTYTVPYSYLDPEWKITSKFRNSGFGKKIGQCNILKQQSKSN